MVNFIAYLVKGSTERDELLAQADFCRMCARREALLGDELGLAADLFAEAERLETAARVH